MARYFGLLSSTGSAKPASVKHLLVRLLIQDMLTYAHRYITEKDYEMFGVVLHNLESSDCLLPYSVYCVNRAAYGVNGNSDEHDE